MKITQQLLRGKGCWGSNSSLFEHGVDLQDLPGLVGGHDQYGEVLTKDRALKILVRFAPEDVRQHIRERVIAEFKSVLAVVPSDKLYKLLLYMLDIDALAGLFNKDFESLIYGVIKMSLGLPENGIQPWRVIELFREALGLAWEQGGPYVYLKTYRNLKLNVHRNFADLSVWTWQISFREFSLAGADVKDAESARRICLQTAENLYQWHSMEGREPC